MWSFLKNLFTYIAKKGEYVRCIDDRDWNSPNQTMNLQYGSIYKVLDVIKCPSCGCISYDIGCRSTLADKITHTVCAKTKNQIPGANFRWAKRERFVRAKFGDINIENLKREIQLCLDKEQYERAAELKKQLDIITNKK